MWPDQQRRLVEVRQNRFDIQRAKVAIVLGDDLIHRFVSHESIILDRLGFPTGNGPRLKGMLLVSIRTIRKGRKTEKKLTPRRKDAKAQRLRHMQIRAKYEDIRGGNSS